MYKIKKPSSAVISRFGLGTNDMVAFFSANCNVPVLPGQTVRFPVPINQSGNAQGDNFTYQTKDGDTLCSVVNMMGLGPCHKVGLPLLRLLLPRVPLERRPQLRV